MAQDVAEKIRAAAIAKGIDPDTALRIAGVESSYNPKAKNPSSSAQGLFQVIDDTWKRYGGKPGKQRDTDENIRVGMLILEDNTNKLSKILGRAPRPSELYTAHFFGTGTGAEVLRADPDTPINRIASKKVMAANPHLKGLTVGQLMAKHEAKFARTPGTPAYAGKKGGERQDDTQKMMTDSLSSGQTAQAQPTVLDDPQIKALGTNYQMALAATTLADKGDKDDDTTESERFQQYMEERQAEAVRAQEPEPARKALASFDLGYKSPFVDDVPAQQEPVRMAVGGTVTNVNALIRPSDKKKLKSANEQLAAYQKSYDQYKTDHEKYLGQRDSHNAAAEKHNERMGEYKTAAQKYEEQLGGYNTAAQKYNEQMGGYKTAAEKYNAEVEAYNAAAIKAKEAADKWLKGYEDAGKGKRTGRYTSSNLFSQRAKDKYARENPAPTFDMTAPAAFDMTAPAAFDMVAPTFNLTQPTFDMTAPVEPNAPNAPTVDPQAIANAAQKETAQRSAALNVFSDPDRYNLSLPKLFAGGGMASSAPPPSTGIRQSDKEAINSANAQWEQYKASVEKYNADADAYNAWHKDYDATVNAPRKHSANSKRPSLEKRHARYIAKNPQPTFDPAAQPVAPGVQPQELLALAQKKASNRNLAVDAFFNPDKYNLSFSEGGAVYRAEGSPETGERLTPQQIEQIAQRETAGREYRQNMLDAPTRGDTYTGLAKGFFQNVVPNVVGIPTDLATMAMRPFGYKVEKPFLGTEYNKEKLTEYGLRPEPPKEGTNERNFYDVGNIASFFVNPASATRKAVAAGEKVVEKGAQAVDTTKKGAKKAKDMLGELKKPKAVPQTAAAPTPEVQTELAQLHQNRQYPRAPGQEPDPFMGVAPTVAEAEANVAARQAEPLPPPPAEVVVPPAMLETPPVAPPMQATAPEVVRPFAGRLDAFIETIKNPVQLGQLKGQLRGKFRDYDLERVERAFTGMDDKTKLTPDQIKQALAGVHSPSKMISETIPPTPGKHWQNNDNVWGAPLGTTNLYLEQTPEILAANEVFKKALKGFGPFMKKGSDPAADSMENARALLTDPELLKIVDPELISNLSKAFDKVEKNVNLVGEYSGVIKNVSDGFQYPILYKDATVASAKYLNQPFFKFSEEALAAERGALKQKFMAQGKNEQDASFLASGEINANFELYGKQAQKIASQKVQELAIAEAQKHGINLPDVSLVKWDELEDVTRPMGGNTGFKESVENALEPSRVTVHEAIKNIKNVMDPEIKKVGDALSKKSDLYAGKHTGVAGKTYPISFTRFSEHEATIPGLGTVQGRHFHELQSDLYNAFTKQGSAYGSRAKDQEELAKLQAQIAKNRSDALDQKQALQAQAQAQLPGNNINAGDYVKKMGEIDKKLQGLNAGLEDRANIVSGRINDFHKQVSYKMQEPFANFETSTDVRRQLLIKGAVHSAMKDGKGFATFPGKESIQPQLYVDMETGRSKVYPNLKQVVKDMGGEKAGFDIREIQLPPDKDGNPVMAWGITWSPETAARVLEKGVPFAKGGMVERQSADTRRYL